MGISAIATYFPIALAACTKSNTANTDIKNDTNNTNIENNIPNTDTENLLSLGTAQKLESAGFLFNKEANVMVVKNSQGELTAVNPTCTHQGCIVDWKKDLDKFVCPCHNAEFAANGAVLAKPAPKPLATYEVTNKNNEILVKLT